MLRTFCLLLCLAFVFTTAVSASYEDQSATNFEIEDAVSSAMDRNYDWELMSTGVGSIWGYGPFYIGNFRIALATPDKANITACITDTAEELMYIYEYTVDDDGAIVESVECIQIIDLNLSGTVLNNAKYVGETTEIWWGMGAYYNTSSAMKDRYWRVYNPRNSITLINFFAYIDEPIHDYSLKYMDCIGEMYSLESAVENYYGLTVPHAILTLTEVTLSAITGALLSASLSADQAENILEVFALRDMADSYYIFILDLDGQA